MKLNIELCVDTWTFCYYVRCALAREVLKAS